MDIALNIMTGIAAAYAAGIIVVLIGGALLRFGTTRESRMGAHLITRCWAWPAMAWFAALEAADEIRGDARAWRKMHRPF
ncbi:hypothetical protein [Nesterenkonia sp. PF2B19]|uniref:hypothetical protein n=1 Tax=Nesterenkonia sp. PF2B19 TaxID=1881858 RepID=UPI000872C3F0|nr:hypothetical protein [Nesterenkonia sp. PF2B19]OSM43476.1 hypothetical protein BCY76_008130 [Nesterenkonia sp. PF2B19]